MALSTLRPPTAAAMWRPRVASDREAARAGRRWGCGSRGAPLPRWRRSSPRRWLQSEIHPLRPRNGISPPLHSWKDGTDCCRAWAGVTCEGKPAKVVALDLSGSSISGGVHPALFSLTSLRSLNLSCNRLNFDSVLSRSFEQLTNLTHLNLSDSGFSGQIPPLSPPSHRSPHRHRPPLPSSPLRHSLSPTAPPSPPPTTLLPSSTTLISSLRYRPTLRLPVALARLPRPSLTLRLTESADRSLVNRVSLVTSLH
ncbi:unnamed protein product [Spirodela intermedia]|uniref:Leucine-rich repeat-containing N-terminal plant-type domain-containing protein n=1 Tax=Spirodela intermedia TaxID=51605 RepID=A0A7I8IAH0_SPIIN|nr:unnamed protein product [Spirodela intermedia]CAA6654727.1 unnamed protein product [Spirodela intermedia]